MKLVKLYKRVDGTLHYWESWSNGGNCATVHWGVVGHEGQSETMESDSCSDLEQKLQTEIDRLSLDDYASIPIEDHCVLLIEYGINGMGRLNDLRKRHALESRMQETLGWTGLGICDGGSIGSGTMEVCCFVVDFEIAKKVIREDLKGTEFGNYTRIYDQNAAC
jgi:predicted DNA-binding WGR domain protein